MGSFFENIFVTWKYFLVIIERISNKKISSKIHSELCYRNECHIYELRLIFSLIVSLP